MCKPKRYLMKPDHIVHLLNSGVDVKLEAIEAMQLSGDGSLDIHIYTWLEQTVKGLGSEEIHLQKSGVSVDPSTGFMMIATTDGVIYAIPSDWIVRYPKGNFDKCEPNDFDKTYEEME